MSFKSFDLSSDVASLVSPINEVISISSSLYATDANVKFFKNIASSSAGTDLGGYWQTLYDSSPTSSLSTPLMDVSFGYATGSAFNLPATLSASQNEKVKIYRQMATVLLGDANSIFTINQASQPECFFILLKRGIQKDEIKKGATQIAYNTNGSGPQVAVDTNAVTNFKQSLGGDYAPLINGSTEVGQVWYNSGIIVLDPSLMWSATEPWSGTKNINESIFSSSINQLVDGLRRKVTQITLHNQTNLYSTVFFCRANNSEFNYSSNPTFVDDSKRIRVTSGSNILQTRTYITTVGLYDANDNLLGVGKVNKPITKSPDTEAIFRMRLDY